MEVVVLGEGLGAGPLGGRSTEEDEVRSRCACGSDQ